MREYFEVQLMNGKGLTEEVVQLYVDSRMTSVVNTYDRNKLEEWFRERIGSKLLYFIGENRSGTKSEVLKVFEYDLDEYFGEGFEFLRMYGNLPRFRTPFGRLNKDAKDYLNTFDEVWR